MATICLHKSTDAKNYPFTEGDKRQLEKIREDVVGGPSILFTRKEVVDETFIRKFTNICKPTSVIDASQLYPYSMCQLMPTGLYTRSDTDSETRRFRPGQNKTRSFEIMDFVCIATLCLNKLVAFTTFFPVKNSSLFN